MLNTEKSKKNNIITNIRKKMIDTKKYQKNTIITNIRKNR